MRPSKSLSLRFTAVALAAWIAAMDAASAQDAVREYRIAEQSLGQALREFALVSNLDLLFSPHLVAGKKSSSLDGKFTVDEGLRTLLRRSGLEFSMSGSRVVISEPKIEPARQATSSSSGPQGTNGYTRLAQGNVPSSRQGEGAQSADEDDTEDREAQSQKRVELEEIVVTGTRLDTSGIQPIPVRVLSKTELEQSGQTTLVDVLSTLPEVSVSATSRGFGGTGTVQLRGLPVGSTLVIVNGRRVSSTGAQSVSSSSFFNLNSVPLAAVERVEVLASGSSAIYGGDALAGVVNIVLRDDYDGADVSASYGHAAGTDEHRVDLSKGWVWDRGSLSVAGTYLSRDPLFGFEREITSSLDFRRYGGPDSRTNLAHPANIFSLTNANLPGLNSAFAAVPLGSAGTGLSPASFAGTAGQLNLGDVSGRGVNIQGTENVGVFSSGKYALSDHLELFGEVMYSRTDVEQFAPSNLTATVPATNAFNPFGVNVRATYQFADPLRIPIETDFVRPLVGLRGDLWGRWSWEAAAWYSSDHTTIDNSVQNPAAMSAALASSDPATALNVFKDGPGASDSVLDSLFTHRVDEYESTEKAANAFVRGSLLALPAGDLDVVIGGEYFSDSLSRVEPTAPLSDQGREFGAIFSEMKIPVWRAAPGSQRRIELTSAVRYDHYSDFGSAVSPQFGAVWQITNELAVRGSYSESFRPPTLLNLFGPTSQFLGNARDPRRGNQTATVPFTTGGNPSIQPETGDATSVGLVFSNSELSGLRASLNHWTVDVDNVIGSPGLQTLLDNEDLFPGRVQRGEPSAADLAAGFAGPILLADRAAVNFGAIRAAGIDFLTAATFKSQFGDFSPFVAATLTYEYDAQITPGAPFVDRVSRLNTAGFAPRWKATGSLKWSSGAWTASATARYVSSYLAADNVRRLGDIWHLDVFGEVDFAKLLPARDVWNGLRFTLGAVNLTDTDVDYSGDTLGYDRTQYDIRGRFVYGRLAYRF